MSRKLKAAKAGRKASGGDTPAVTGPVWCPGDFHHLQNTEKVQFQFLFLKFTWPMWCTPLWWPPSGHWCGSVLASCVVTDAAERA